MNEKFFCFLLLIALSSAQRDCPCDNPSLCKPVQPKSDKEVFMFVTSNDEKSWKKFVWKKITTLVFFDIYDEKLYCYAHQNNVRVVYKASFDVDILDNESQQALWIDKQLNYAMENFLEGINIDVEFEIDRNDGKKQNSLTKFMKNLSDKFHERFPSSQVTFDAPWAPYNAIGNGIDNRNYDFLSIAKYTDFLFVMAYDIQSQMYYSKNVTDNECYARANSGFSDVAGGLLAYINMGVPNEKLVLGLPWYGYDYECTDYDEKNFYRCHIKQVPFRGANCSDAAGHQLSYGKIMDLKVKYNSYVYYDEHASCPYILYKDANNRTHQVFFDDSYSLELKNNYVKEFNLRGYGSWNANCLNYTDSKQVSDIWETIPNV